VPLDHLHLQLLYDHANVGNLGLQVFFFKFEKGFNHHFLFAIFGIDVYEQKGVDDGSNAYGSQPN
jgi:hypothetical protein